MEKRFEIRDGKFGKYFHDIPSGVDMPLENVLRYLNHWNSVDLTKALESKLQVAVEAIAVALIDLRNSDDQNESIQNAYSLLDEAFKKIKAKQ